MKSGEGDKAMITKYLLLKEELSSREKELKAYCKKNGNIDYDGKQFGHYEDKPTMSYDGKGIWEYIRDNSNDEFMAVDMLFENFHLNQATIEKISKKLDIDIDELKKLATEKPRKSFGFLL
jgi:hypothetical protein